MQIGSEGFHYDSAHFLPEVPTGHKCGRLHGHTYRLFVTVAGPVRDDGFVVDFSEVKDAIQPLVDQLDHRLINDIEGLENPTVENQLLWFWDRSGLGNKFRMKLYEGLSNYGEYGGEAYAGHSGLVHIDVEPRVGQGGGVR